MQQASCLEGDLLMWMLLMYLHVNLKFDYDDDSPELKGQLTLNLEGSIVVTCRSNIAKIVRLEIQDGHHCCHL